MLGSSGLTSCEMAPVWPPRSGDLHRRLMLTEWNFLTCSHHFESWLAMPGRKRWGSVACHTRACPHNPVATSHTKPMSRHTVIGPEPCRPAVVPWHHQADQAGLHAQPCPSHQHPTYAGKWDECTRTRGVAWQSTATDCPIRR